jgi:hypothetical protein
MYTPCSWLKRAEVIISHNIPWGHKLDDCTSPNFFPQHNFHQPKIACRMHQMSVCKQARPIFLTFVARHNHTMGHSRKHPYHPHGGNRKLTPYPRCLNTFAIIRNKFFSPPPPDGRNFLRGGSMDLFWNDPMKSIVYIYIYKQCLSFSDCGVRQMS